MYFSQWRWLVFYLYVCFLFSLLSILLPHQLRMHNECFETIRKVEHSNSTILNGGFYSHKIRCPTLQSPSGCRECSYALGEKTTLITWVERWATLQTQSHLQVVNFTLDNAHKQIKHFSHWKLHSSNNHIHDFRYNYFIRMHKMASVNGRQKQTNGARKKQQQPVYSVQSGKEAISFLCCAQHLLWICLWLLP